MRLNVGPTKCKKATNVKSSLGTSSLQDKSTMDVPLTVAVLFHRTTKEFQFRREPLVVLDGCSSKYQGR